MHTCRSARFWRNPWGRPLSSRFTLHVCPAVSLCREPDGSTRDDVLLFLCACLSDYSSIPGGERSICMWHMHTCTRFTEVATASIILCIDWERLLPTITSILLPHPPTHLCSALQRLWPGGRHVRRTGQHQL